MRRKSFYNAFLTLFAVAVLSVGGLAQGKGNKHGGGDKSNRGGGHEKHQGRGHDDRGRGNDKHERRGNDDRGDRGNGNGWGRQKRDDGGQQRAIIQQQRQNEWNARREQRQNEQNARRQQQQNVWAGRDQQRQNERAARDQQRAYDRQVRDQQRYASVPQITPVYPHERRRDNGRHLGWYKNGKAYGARDTRDNWTAGMYRDWRRDDNDRRDDRRRRSSQQNSYTYYTYSDPVVNYLPVYQQQYYRPSGSTRENVLRSLIAGFFGGQQEQYYQPVYQGQGYYQPYQSYQTYTPYYGQQPYYQTASYSPTYGAYSPYYGGNGYGYDPYVSNSYSPYMGTQMFGGGGLKSTLLNVGLSLLQGFLGNSYQQGYDQGQYVRDYYDRPVTTYYDPYAAPEPAYYSPLASSFADQRRLLEEGYRMGYRDAMLERDMYGDNVQVDLVSQFLANSLVNRV